jgi:phosphoglucomutase
MISKDDVIFALDEMILSASGWRGIFAGNGEEEGRTAEISAAHRIISGAAALIFAEYLKNMEQGAGIKEQKDLVLIGSDTRPTGKAIVDAMIPVLLSSGCDVRYAGVTAAPEIMAWARSVREESRTAGFIYVSASHNPIGHNGLKFGLLDGGVLPAEKTVKLIEHFRSFLEKDDCIDIIDELTASANQDDVQNVYNNVESSKSDARKAYYDFCGEVAWSGDNAFCETLKKSLKENPLGVVCDFNGSARTESIDRDFFASLGLKFDSINDNPGDIVHRIVPEGESLEPCCHLLEKEHHKDPSFLLGYMPDCDGDRGNLVILDNSSKKARALEAQEVFALACVAELAHMVYTGVSFAKMAVVVNDPTSMRIDAIAKAFGASVFRAEVGEANVVGLARKLRSEGYTVRILGEGSAGGNITHPSAVRDPLHTVIALVKLLSIRSRPGHPGFFDIWCGCSGQKYRNDFTLADIIASLPQFVTTSAYSKDAVLRVKTRDHSLLKHRYQEIFILDWEERLDELQAHYGIYGWEAFAYNGQVEKKTEHFMEAENGGLKIIFKNSEGFPVAYIWMRGSATEPVFRIMADVQGADAQFERDLLDWQRNMIMEADAL